VITAIVVGSLLAFGGTMVYKFGSNMEKKGRAETVNEIQGFQNEQRDRNISKLRRFQLDRERAKSERKFDPNLTGEDRAKRSLEMFEKRH